MASETDTTPDTTDPDVFYCARHPQIETVLRCNRCDTPICPRCLVQTPVGAKCPTCANVSRLPTVDVTLPYLSRGFGAATVAGAVVGAAWAYISGPNGLNFVGFFLIFLAMGMGWVVSESIALATNRKRSTALASLAVYAMVLAYFVHTSLAFHVLIPRNDVWGMLAAAFAAFWAYQRLKP
jgi:hypothetical protein